MRFHKLTQVYTLADIKAATEEKRAVICPLSAAWKNHAPASFIFNLPGCQIQRLLELGPYLYPKNGKEKPHAPWERRKPGKPADLVGGALLDRIAELGKTITIYEGYLQGTSVTESRRGF
jgi:hypothetical protein